MVLLLKLIIINTIWTLGLTIATSKGMVFYSVREWAEARQAKGNKWVEPLILCIYCMVSFHSVIAYLFAYGLGFINYWSWELLILLPLVIMGSSLLNGLIWGVHKLLDSANQYFENAQKILYMDITDRKSKSRR